jgi:hypothetical protein
MDLDRLDAVARSLAGAGSRRRLLGLLGTTPALGGLLGLLAPDDTTAKDRRRRRKGRHKRRKDPGARKGKGCRPKSRETVCAGRCGPVKSRQTCGKTVDCGSCDCATACSECFACQGNAGAPGTCVPQLAGTPCGDTATCENGTLQPQGSCNGSGTCEPADPVSCAPYTLCDGNACATSCSDDAECVPGSYCDAGHCTDDLPDGEPCGSNGQCLSGHCVDGVCCDTACDGACQACNLGGSIGTCTAVPNGVSCAGGNLCCAGTSPVCDANVCVPCSLENPCPTGQCCVGDGSCGPCLAFLSSSTHFGDLGGLTGADAICQGLADAAGLPGRYKAWLSDDTGSPSTRFMQATVPYRLTTGTKIAGNWADLTSGTLDAPLDVTETGGTAGRVVWTNTNADGTVQDFQDCGNWLTGTSAETGNFGDVNGTNHEWTAFGRRSCGPPPPTIDPLHLYCFQQS